MLAQPPTKSDVTEHRGGGVGGSNFLKFEDRRQLNGNGCAKSTEKVEGTDRSDNGRGRNDRKLGLVTKTLHQDIGRTATTLNLCRPRARLRASVVKVIGLHQAGVDFQISSPTLRIRSNVIFDLCLT